MARPATVRQRELASLHTVEIGRNHPTCGDGAPPRPGGAKPATTRPRKSGLEIALLGVDGAGKTSVANAFRRLTRPVKVIAMGSAHFRCLPMLERFFPSPVVQLVAHCERTLPALVGILPWMLRLDRSSMIAIHSSRSIPGRHC